MEHPVKMRYGACDDARNRTIGAVCTLGNPAFLVQRNVLAEAREAGMGQKIERSHVDCCRIDARKSCAARALLNAHVLNVLRTAARAALRTTRRTEYAENLPSCDTADTAVILFRAKSRESVS